jgi:AI-2 transport protein TqsA
MRDPEKLSEISRMSQYIIDFLIVRTETNVVHGVLFGGALWVMGVHAAVVWGLLTFLLGYIPYIGLIVAAIPAIFFAYIQFGRVGSGCGHRDSLRAQHCCREPGLFLPCVTPV